MAFRPELDLGVADWWVGADDWTVAQERGPDGYAAYVRLRPHDPEGPGRPTLWLLLDYLAKATTTSDDVLVAQWDGGTIRQAGAPPHFLPQRVLDLPFATRGQDEYLLLRGRLARSVADA